LSGLSEESLPEACSKLTAAAGTAAPDHFIKFVVEVSIQCMHVYDRLKAQAPLQAESALLASRLMQLAVSGVTLGKQKLTDAGDKSFTPLNLWRTRREAFETAAANECKHLLGFPSFQEAHTAAFHGTLGEYIAWYDRTSRRDLWGLSDRVFFVVVVLAQLVVQPVCFVILTFFPMAEDWLRALLEPERFTKPIATCLRASVLPNLPFPVEVSSMLWAADPYLRLYLDFLSGLYLLYLVINIGETPDLADVETHTSYFIPYFVVQDAVWSVIAAFAIAVGSLLHEVNELAKDQLFSSPLRTIFKYLNDNFNAFDVIGLGLSAWGTGEYIRAWAAGEEGAKGHHFMLSVATLFLTLRLMKLWNLSETLGPYLQMLFKMLTDLAKLMSLGLPIIAAHAFAMHVLFKAYADEVEGCATPGDPGAQEDAESIFRENTFMGFAVMLEQLTAGTDSNIECLRASGAGWSAWVIQLSFSLIMIVLLLNVIIAAMAKTFDLIYESLDLTAMLVRAKLIQNATSLNVAPPPLNLLGYPARIVWAIVNLVVFPYCMPSYKKLEDEEDLALTFREPTKEERIRSKKEYLQLKASAEEFVEEHRAEADAEEKFRRIISQRVLEMSKILNRMEAERRQKRAKVFGGGSGLLGGVGTKAMKTFGLKKKKRKDSDDF